MSPAKIPAVKCIHSPTISTIIGESIVPILANIEQNPIMEDLNVEGTTSIAQK